MSQKVEIAGHGLITFGKIRNYEPARLPWYKNAAKIPTEMRAAAEKVATEKSTSAEEVEWRMQNWAAWMTGWSFNVRCYYPWFMFTPDEALESIAKICMHEWVRGDERTVQQNNILGTWDRGYTQVCSKCGKEEYVQTSFNNYSGD